MTRESSSDGRLPESIAGEGWMGLLRTLGREEILEVLESDGFCGHCQTLLHSRIQNLINNRKLNELSISTDKSGNSTEFQSADSSVLSSSEGRSTRSMADSKSKWSSLGTPESVNSRRQIGYVANSSPSSVNSKHLPSSHTVSEILRNDRLNGAVSSASGNGLAEAENERVRIAQVGRKKDFCHMERVNGKMVNVVKGLELHTRVFNAEEQKKIVDCVYGLQRMGQKGQLRERTYTEPRKWMRGKGRVTIQFGCCYNYAVDKNGNLPGIVRDEEVDPLPPLFKQMIKRLVRWQVLPSTCVPNSCIVNIYDEGDCIPPHIDHHDFVRPFCTVSFLAECNILFGSNLKILSPGEFTGPVSIPLPVGSVLILSGNGADVAKHCVPGVPAKRISITFRKMDASKLPHSYSPDPELLGLKPATFSSAATPHVQQTHQDNKKNAQNPPGISTETGKSLFNSEKDDFPPLGSLKSGKNGRRQ